MRILTYLLIALTILGGIAFQLLQQPKFGKLPSGERLKRIQQSPNYRDGAFQNQHETPSFTEGDNMATVLYRFLFTSVKDNTPAAPITPIKTSLKNLPTQEDYLVWFGHSSYLMQLSGKTFLVDPVFSGNAGPFKFATKAFAGTDAYGVEDLPKIDYLLITHDHWDHLDYETVKQLSSRVTKVVCGLGVGEHLTLWGFKPEQIIEQDWYDSTTLAPGFTIHTLPARHFSGRLFARNKSLWASFVLQTPSQQIYVGGDSGYDTHFAEIGQKFGNLDLAIIENGQYNKSWRYIHLLPEEQVKAMQDLKAKRLLSVHNSKFALASHSWHEPLELVSEAMQTAGIPLLTPQIGELVRLADSTQTFTKWWRK